MLTNCFTCDQPVSENARFCSKCATQIRCKDCGEDLVSGAIVCEMCGVEVMQRQAASIPMNQFKYRDGRKDVSIEAAFTNEVGQSAATIFAMLRGGQAPPPVRLHPRPSKESAEQGNLFAPAEVVNEQNQESLPQLAAPHPARGSSALHILFERQDDDWVLNNPNLKAKNKKDFVRRATCLFLQFQEDNGVKPVLRNDVVKLLQDCSVYDANARDWFTKEKNLIRATSTELTLILPGKELVNEILQEIEDDTVPNIWKLGTVRKSGRKGASKKDKIVQDRSGDDK